VTRRNFDGCGVVCFMPCVCLQITDKGAMKFLSLEDTKKSLNRLFDDGVIMEFRLLWKDSEIKYTVTKLPYDLVSLEVVVNYSIDGMMCLSGSMCAQYASHRERLSQLPCMHLKKLPSVDEYKGLACAKERQGTFQLVCLICGR
jgi:hypothetical protein